VGRDQRWKKSYIVCHKLHTLHSPGFSRCPTIQSICPSTHPGGQPMPGSMHPGHHPNFVQYLPGTTLWLFKKHSFTTRNLLVLHPPPIKVSEYPNKNPIFFRGEYKILSLIPKSI
jgi:hypothetical protein